MWSTISNFSLLTMWKWCSFQSNIDPKWLFHVYNCSNWAECLTQLQHFIPSLLHKVTWPLVGHHSTLCSLHWTLNDSGSEPRWPYRIFVTCLWPPFVFKSESTKEVLHVLLHSAAPALFYYLTSSWLPLFHPQVEPSTWVSDGGFRALVFQHVNRAPRLRSLSSEARRFYLHTTTPVILLINLQMRLRSPKRLQS